MTWGETIARIEVQRLFENVPGRTDAGTGLRTSYVG